jgi:hypothetical protein
MAGKTWAFSRHYIRRGMLIATWALFILASLEWTAPQLPSAPPANVEQTISPAIRPVHVGRTVFTGRNLPTIALPQAAPAIRLQTHPPASLAPRWLLLRTLRL